MTASNVPLGQDRGLYWGQLGQTRHQVPEPAQCNQATVPSQGQQAGDIPPGHHWWGPARVHGTAHHSTTLTPGSRRARVALPPHVEAEEGGVDEDKGEMSEALEKERMLDEGNSGVAVRGLASVGGR